MKTNYTRPMSGASTATPALESMPKGHLISRVQISNPSGNPIYFWPDYVPTPPVLTTQTAAIAGVVLSAVSNGIKGVDPLTRRILPYGTITGMSVALGVTTITYSGGPTFTSGDVIHIAGITGGPVTINGNDYTTSGAAAGSVDVTGDLVGSTPWTAGGVIGWASSTFQGGIVFSGTNIYTVDGCFWRDNLPFLSFSGRTAPAGTYNYGYDYAYCCPALGDIDIALGCEAEGIYVACTAALTATYNGILIEEEVEK